MKTAQEIFGNEVEYSYYDYQPIIESFGEVLLQVDDADYQGDTRVVLKRQNLYGILIFGWGSCSGCDALQACNGHSDVDKLITSLNSDIKWFESLEALKEYSAKKDWELEWAWHSDETKDFVEKIKTL